MRLLGPVLFGLAGVGLLVGLGVWQLQRLDWKLGVITEIETKLAASPAALPAAPDPAVDEFRRVAVRGAFIGTPGAHGRTDAAVLTSLRGAGPGYRVIQPFRTEDGRLILVDRGFVPVAEKNVAARADRSTPWREGPIDLAGALRWPDERDAFAPASAGDADNVFLARDVPRLAALWGAEPVLIVAETATADGPWPRPLPQSADLPNDHFGYAMTWFALAAIWGAMSALLVRREARRPLVAARPSA